jgi:hypothetical protein
MDFLKQITDPYDCKARLYPALLVLLPLFFVFATFFYDEIGALKLLLSIVVGAGGMFFLAQLARDKGKTIETDLFRVWGGMPSVAIFRHRDTSLDTLTKQRYHEVMSNIIKEASAPSNKMEKKNPDEADKVYVAWSSYLRTHTRDKKRFPLVFVENINYGYRRNTLGMKAWGIIFSLASTIAVGVGNPVYLYFALHQKFWINPIDPLLLCSFLFSLSFLLFWIFKVTKAWVKIPADAYSQRLIETIDELSEKKESRVNPKK